MNLLEGKPAALPGICFSCRFHGAEKWIDLALSTDPEDMFPREPGAVYICENCVQEMAHLMGYITPEEAQALRIENERLKDENSNVIAINEAVQSANGALVAASLAVGVDLNTVRGFRLVHLEDQPESADDFGKALAALGRGKG